ncbi:helix-turn-helix transcriptional regulator [Streptomyces sp. NPDC058650]|uniref:helix-turn-helix transcriptional regulator n=1 Tax=Streptomyces sp. NPDC058650 TaxID=3346575 RepID=UPI003660E0AD
MNGPVLDTPRAAEYCGLATGTFYNLRSSGEGPKAYKHGRKTVYFPVDLDSWLAERLTPAPTKEKHPGGNRGESEERNESLEHDSEYTDTSRRGADVAHV